MVSWSGVSFSCDLSHTACVCLQHAFSGEHINTGNRHVRINSMKKVIKSVMESHSDDSHGGPITHLENKCMLKPMVSNSLSFFLPLIL